MAVRRIVYCGHPALRRKARLVRNIDADLIELLEDLAETMYSENGLGLAAAQVADSAAAVVVRRDPDGEETLELINPRIVEQEGEQDGSEGCLSLPTLRGSVLRPERVVVQALDREGERIVVEGEGLMARCLAHELDHLEGRLFIDTVDADSLCWLTPDSSEESGYRLEPTTIEEAREAFDRLNRQRRDED